ncbi:MAG: RNA methyltransferase [Thermoplasmatales archaeon]|nr:RNA methyltransferase [Thermoplasmatales archaeon]
MDCFIIVVEPKYAGNLGAIARIMKNFGFKKLIVVSPSFDIDSDDCRKYAMHAQEIIDNAKISGRFEDAIKEMDYVVGTTSKESKHEKHHLRKAIDSREFAKEIYKIEGNVGIVFGREDYGLLNEELKKCDLIVKIPTSKEYPSLNLSHAVSILLYELFIHKRKQRKRILADGKEKEKLYEFFRILLEEVDYPEHKKENTEIMFRRIMGRAMLSKWEYHTLMGVLKKAINAVKK